MPATEIKLGNLTYVLRSEEGQAHLNEVAELVRRKVDGLRRENPNLSLQKATMLVACDLASEFIKGQKRGLEYRSEILEKAHHLLKRVEQEIDRASQPSLNL